MEALCSCPERSGRATYVQGAPRSGCATFWKGLFVRLASLKIEALCPNVQIWPVHLSVSVLGKHSVKALCYYVHALNVQVVPNRLKRI
jgi:hypothetical protein